MTSATISVQLWYPLYEAGKSGSAACAGTDAGAATAAGAARGGAMTRGPMERARRMGARRGSRMRGGCQIGARPGHPENAPRSKPAEIGDGLDSATFCCHDCTVPDDPYSLADLARLADVTPRTVRYYVAQGLLPSPDAAGPATRYGEGHLARLRLIRRLQREHLPLAEIRARLRNMTDDQILDQVDLRDAQPGDRPAALDFVHELMAQSGVRPTRTPHSAAEAAAPYRSTRAQRIELAALAAPDAAPPRAAAAPPAPSAPPPAEPVAPAGSSQPDRSTWERLAITPDVELHVRRPLDRRTNRRVDQLEQIARELLRDDV